MEADNHCKIVALRDVSSLRRSWLDSLIIKEPFFPDMIVVVVAKSHIPRRATPPTTIHTSRHCHNKYRYYLIDDLFNNMTG